MLIETGLSQLNKQPQVQQYGKHEVPVKLSKPSEVTDGMAHL